MKSKTVVILVLVMMAAGAGFMAWRTYRKAKTATK